MTTYSLHLNNQPAIVTKGSLAEIHQYLKGVYAGFEQSNPIEFGMYYFNMPSTDDDFGLDVQNVADFAHALNDCFNNQDNDYAQVSLSKQGINADDVRLEVFEIKKVA